jgi:ABC-type tungstate transport system substrate-binding protein
MDLWRITWFTAATAAGATLLMLPPGVALAWLLARREFRGKTIVDTVASLPLVMPPVATGLILLYLVGRRSPVGAALAAAGIDIVFTWKAVVLAMTVMGFPLLVRTARAGFEQVPDRYEQIAATLGARPLRVFFTITVPLAGRCSGSRARSVNSARRSSLPAAFRDARARSHLRFSNKRKPATIEKPSFCSWCPWLLLSRPWHSRIAS